MMDKKPRPPPSKVTEDYGDGQLYVPNVFKEKLMDKKKHTERLYRKSIIPALKSVEIALIE